MLRSLNSRLAGLYQYIHLIFGSSSYQPSLPSDDQIHQAGRLFQILRDRSNGNKNKDTLLIEAHDILRDCSDLTTLLEVTGGTGYNVLQMAVIKNDKDFLDLLVLEGCDLNQGKCSLPLHLACHLGNIHLVEYLVHCGADTTLEKGMCYPQSHRPIRHVPSRFHFLETDIFACDSNHQLPLMYAIKSDHAEIVKLLLEGNKGPDANWPHHRMPLHEAAKSGALQTVQYLLSIKPSNIKIVSDEGLTPVLCAVKWGKRFIEQFIEAGADLHTLTTKKQSALHLVFQNLQDPLQLFETTKYLLCTGLEQEINVTDNHGNSALHELISLVNRKVSSFGNSHSVENQKDFDNQVLDTLKLLLSHNSDPNIMNLSGVMVMHKLILLLDCLTNNNAASLVIDSLPAKETYKVDFDLVHRVLHVLLEHHAQVNQSTSAGRTPIVLLLQSALDSNPHFTVDFAPGYLQCLTLLCKYGAHPSHTQQTHIAVVNTLVKLSDKCLQQRTNSLRDSLSLFVQDIMVTLLQNGMNSNHCSLLAKQATGNVLTEMVKLCGCIRQPSDLTYIYNWVLTAIQWGANPDVEPYPSDSIIVHSQSSIFLKAKGAQPVHHYMYHIQDFNQIFEGGHAENLLMLFFNSMDHQPLYQCLSSAKVMSRFDPNRTPTYSFIKLVSRLASQPRSLQQIARVAIYKALQRQLKLKVDHLPLPKPLKLYLLNVE